MLHLLLSLLLDIDARLDQLFKGRADRLTGQFHDLIIHELGHARRLHQATREGRLDAVRDAARAVKPELLQRSSGAPVDPATVWKELRTAQVVAFAETHDHVRCHEIQLEALENLDTGKGDLAVGFEMFQRPAQPVLDQWVRGELTEWEFLEKVNWYRSWGFPYPLFRPIFLYCREHRIPMIALNAPQEVTRKVGRTGLRSLTDAERALVAEDLRLTDRANRRNFDEIFTHHPGINLDFYYEAFCVWDETMAESAARHLRKAGGRMLVIAGSGHIRGGLGIPERIRRRTGGTFRILYTRDTGSAEENFDTLLAPGADVLWWTSPSPSPERPRLGLATSPDLVVTVVAPGSAAEKAGVRIGDVLKRAGRRELTQPESIRHFLELRRREEFRLVVARDGRDVELEVTVPLK